MLKPIFGAVLLVLINHVHTGYSLRCWACSSDIDRSCSDRFNGSDFIYGGGYYQQQRYDPHHHDYNNNNPYNNQQGSYNQPGYNPQGQPGYNQQQGYNPQGQQPYDQRGRNFDPNYPRDYQNQNQNMNRPRYSSNTFNNAGPRLVDCNEDEARINRMRSVCIKKVQKIGSDQLTYIRRCEMIPYDKDIGTCYDPVSRGISLEFCEYCEYDGCNSARSIKLNAILTSIIPLVLVLVFKSC